MSASPQAVYRAFANPGLMERWLPPDGMSGEMHHFDFRNGGSFRMVLTYAASSNARGKSSEKTDEVNVRLTKLEEGQRIEQEVTFDSEDPAFAGIMRMIWTFEPRGAGTLVSIRAENVPDGIRPEDHVAGLTSSLQKLAQLVEQQGVRMP